jgi:hypothetical protein
MVITILYIYIYYIIIKKVIGITYVQKSLGSGNLRAEFDFKITCNCDVNVM